MAFYRFYSSQQIPRIDIAEKIFLEMLRANAPKAMSQARKILRKNTPTGETGALKSRVTTWGLHTNVAAGFYFYLGWRKGDFGQKFYPPYVELGTGLYGKYKRRIVPRKAKMLAWESASGFHVAKSVRGQRPQYMLARSQTEWVQWFLKWMEQIRVMAYRRLP